MFGTIKNEDQMDKLYERINEHYKTINRELVNKIVHRFNEIIDLLYDFVYPKTDNEKIDKEIVSLRNKKNPNYLFIGHALFPNTCFEENYYQTMTKIYGDMLKCNCDILYSNELTDLSIVEKKLSWADIIYEGGGNTANMIDLWQKTGFDKKTF